MYFTLQGRTSSRSWIPLVARYFAPRNRAIVAPDRYTEFTFSNFFLLVYEIHFQCCNEQRAFKLAVTNSNHEVVIKADRPFR